MFSGVKIWRFHAPAPNQEKFLRLYSEKVVPKLRTAFGWSDFRGVYRELNRRMVETSLEAVALAEPRCYLTLSRQCPHQVDREQ
jgi:hypothetical protein